MRNRNAVTRRPERCERVSRWTGEEILHRRMAWWPSPNGGAMVYCVGQAEHPAGLHTGRSNLPNRRGELVLSLPKYDPYG